METAREMSDVQFSSELALASVGGGWEGVLRIVTLSAEPLALPLPAC